MTRENAQAKGRRLLVEGRLRVLCVEGSGLILAECRGDSGEMYRIQYDPERMRWYCTCPAKGVCSHLVALQLVVTLPVREGAAA